jgi:hypothetical protein
MGTSGNPFVGDLANFKLWSRGLRTNEVDRLWWLSGIPNLTATNTALATQATTLSNRLNAVEATTNNPNGAALTNLVHSSTVSSSNATVTITRSKNSDGSTNFDLSVSGGGGSTNPPAVSGGTYTIVATNGSGVTVDFNTNLFYADPAGSSVKIGYNAVSASTGVAIGQEAAADYNALALGSSAYAERYSLALGFSSWAAGTNNFAFGWGAQVLNSSWSNTVEIGTGGAVSNGWLHYLGRPIVSTGGVLGVLDGRSLTNLPQTAVNGLTATNANYDSAFAAINAAINRFTGATNDVLGYITVINGRLTPLENSTNWLNLNKLGTNGDGGSVTNLQSTNIVTAAGSLASSGNATNYTVNLLPGEHGNIQQIYLANTNAYITVTGTNIADASRSVLFRAWTNTVASTISFKLPSWRTNATLSLTVSNGYAALFNFYNPDTTGTNVMVSDAGRWH